MGAIGGMTEPEYRREFETIDSYSDVDADNLQPGVTAGRQALATAKLLKVWYS